MAEIMYFLHEADDYLNPSRRQNAHTACNREDSSADKPPEESQHLSHLAANAACSASDFAQCPSKLDLRSAIAASRPATFASSAWTDLSAAAGLLAAAFDRDVVDFAVAIFNSLNGCNQFTNTNYGVKVTFT